jgi:glycine cleavage system aminomethyltransferase T
MLWTDEGRRMERELNKTPLNAWHREHGGQMVEFAGWEMPISYRRGIIEEHLGTRRYGGLFDISHMGRFSVSGKDAVPFLQHVLTNNALALDPGMAQYTMISTEIGGALDDAYLYRLDEDDRGLGNFFLSSTLLPERRIGIGSWNKERNFLVLSLRIRQPRLA